MKLTKRKGFNFFRSYFDVYNELNDKEKVMFIDALLDRQFLGIKPTKLTGMAKFAYISQTNSIDSQVKGFEDKTGIILTPTAPPTDGGNVPPTVQVEGKGEVKEEGQVKEEGAAQIVKNLEWFVNQIDEIYLENLEYTHKGKDIQQAVKEAYAHVASDSLRLKNLDGAGAKKLLNTWLANMKIQANGNGINKKTADDNATADYLRKHYSAKLKQQ